jgi:polyhydroxyalkanoate synthesis regulator phasin
MGGAVLLAGLLVGASFALAQETEEPEVAVAGDALDRGFHLFREGAHMVRGHLDRIAEELGTTPEELRDQLADGATLEEIATAAGVDLDALFEELRLEALVAVDQQVAEGSLTEEQADRIKERIESFEPGEGFFGGHRGFRGGLPGLGGFFGDLDLDMEELRELMESGMSLDEALDSMGVDLDALVAEATAEALAHIDELVAEGNLTEEQADRIKERIESFELGDGLPFGLGGFRFPPDGFGHHHGPGLGFFGDEGANVEEALLDA